MTDIEALFPVGSQIGSATDNLVEAQELLFNSDSIDSPLSDWARIRQSDFGESIKPSHLYMVGKNGKPHTVAWLHRSGINLETGDTYSFYHIACDCMPEAAIREEPEFMFTCEGLGTAIIRRAQEVREFYGLPVILPSNPEEKMGTSGKQIAISTMVHILERDQLHPETWVANYMSGRHELPLLSVVLNRDVEELTMYASMLEEAGKLEIDNDTTVRLSQAA